MSDLSTGWISFGGGEIDIIDGGHGSHVTSFVHYNRTDFKSGPGQILDSKCLSEGIRYEINAKFKLRDSSTGNFVSCNKEVGWSHEEYCLLMTVSMRLPGEVSETRVHIGNKFGGIWLQDEFNSFRNTVTINENMARAEEIYIHFRGPRADVDIIFDEVSMKRLI